MTSAECATAAQQHNAWARFPIRALGFTDDDAIAKHGTRKRLARAGQVGLPRVRH